MIQDRIMYVCTLCAEEFSEACGHFDRSDLRVMPDGKWLCEGCFDETTQADRGATLNDDCDDGEDDYRGWCDLPAPPEYGPLPPSERSTEGKPNGDI